MQLRKYRELFLLIFAVWSVILGGFLLIDIFIVPIDTGIPGSFGSLINDGLQILISVVLVLVFLYVWDRLTLFYYDYYKKQRIKRYKNKEKDESS